MPLYPLQHLTFFENCHTKEILPASVIIIKHLPQPQNHLPHSLHQNPHTGIDRRNLHGRPLIHSLPAAAPSCRSTTLLIMPIPPSIAHHLDEHITPAVTRPAPTTKLHTEVTFSVFFLGFGSGTEIPSFSFIFPQARLTSFIIVFSPKRLVVCHDWL